MSGIGGARHTSLDKPTRSLDFARCELRALRRRLEAEPRLQTATVERSVKETAELMRTVSAQLRALSARNKQSA